MRIKLLYKSPDFSMWDNLVSVMGKDRQFVASWFSAWGRSFLPVERWRGPMHWLVAYRLSEQHPSAIFPLAKQIYFFFSTISLGGYYFPFRSIPVESSSAVKKEIADSLARQAVSIFGKKCWRFGPVVKSDNIIIDLLASFNNQGYKVHEKSLGFTQSIKLPPRFEDYEAEVAGGIIKKAKYFERRLCKAGPVEFLRFKANDPLWSTALDFLSEIESKSWVFSENGDTKFVGAKNKQFWIDSVMHPGVGESVNCWVILFCGNPIAYSLNVDGLGVKYILANGYDEAYKIHSPGTILSHHIFKDACENGFQLIDWGLGDSGYKDRWGAKNNLELVDYFLVPDCYWGKIIGKFVVFNQGFKALEMNEL